MMSAVAEAKKLIAKHGADLMDSDGDLAFLSAWAPAGVNWKATGCHNLCAHYDDTMGKTQAWKNLLEDLRKGVYPCDQDDCDTCTEG